MNVLLDANIYFAILATRAFRASRDDLGRLAPPMFLSSVVRAELLQGAKGELGRDVMAEVGRTLAAR